MGRNASLSVLQKNTNQTGQTFATKTQQRRGSGLCTVSTTKFKKCSQILEKLHNYGDYNKQQQQTLGNKGYSWFFIYTKFCLSVLRVTAQPRKESQQEHQKTWKTQDPDTQFTFWTISPRESMSYKPLMPGNQLVQIISIHTANNTCILYQLLSCPASESWLM